MKTRMRVPAKVKDNINSVLLSTLFQHPSCPTPSPRSSHVKNKPYICYLILHFMKIMLHLPIWIKLLIFGKIAIFSSIPDKIILPGHLISFYPIHSSNIRKQQSKLHILSSTCMRCKHGPNSKLL